MIEQSEREAEQEDGKTGRFLDCLVSRSVVLPPSREGPLSRRGFVLGELRGAKG
jgi:hypothetical protein